MGPEEPPPFPGDAHLCSVSLPLPEVKCRQTSCSADEDESTGANLGYGPCGKRKGKKEGANGILGQRRKMSLLEQ